jgi:hypothetical protein
LIAREAELAIAAACTSLDQCEAVDNRRRDCGVAGAGEINSLIDVNGVAWMGWRGHDAESETYVR